MVFIFSSISVTLLILLLFVIAISWGAYQRSAFPNAISREPDFSQKNLGNFPSQAFGNILFPVPSQSRHSKLAISRRPVSVPKMKQEFPNWKFFVYKFPKFPKFNTGREISCWVLFLFHLLWVSKPG